MNAVLPLPGQRPKLFLIAAAAALIVAGAVAFAPSAAASPDHWGCPPSLTQA